MKKLFLSILLFTICTNLFAQSNEEEERKDYTEAFQLIEVWLDAQKDFDNLPMITASIVQDQEIIWSGAYGMVNREEKLTAKTSTLCSICSISKLFTSIAVMQLYEQEKLRLDDEIQDLLPWFNLKQQYENSWPITVRTLLSHSSGLPRENYYSHWNGPDFDFPSKEEIIDALSDQQTLYPASTYYQYSNLALTLLGYIVEEITGTSYEAYVQTNILDSLELSDTRPNMPEELHGTELAIGYSPENRQRLRKPLAFFEAEGVNAAAGFSSNVLDLAKLAIWQNRLYESDETEVLKPATLKNMHNIHWMDSDFEASRGLGFNVSKWLDDQKWVGHGGYCPGYQSTLMLNPDTKRAYSVMINANGVSPNSYVAGMHNLLSETPDPTTPERLEELKEYTGIYTFDIMEESFVGTWGGDLVFFNLTSDDPAESMNVLKEVKKDHFRRVRDNDELGESYRFIRDTEGKIEGVMVFNNYRFEKK